MSKVVGIAISAAVVLLTIWAYNRFTHGGGVASLGMQPAGAKKG